MVKKKFLIVETNFRYKYRATSSADAVRQWIKKEFIKGTKTTKPDRKGVFTVRVPPNALDGKKVKLVASVLEVKKPKPMKRLTTPIPSTFAPSLPLAPDGAHVLAYAGQDKPRLWTEFKLARRAARLLAERYGGKFSFY